MSRSFLQTIEWLDFQKEVGHKVWRFDDGPTSPNGFEGHGKIRANIIKLGLPLSKSFLYIPHGPEIEFENIKGGIKNELTNFIKYLKDLAREEKAIFVKIEPLSDMVIELLYRRGVKRSSKQIQPYKTVILDLNFPEARLLERMHQKTRYNINLSEKKGLKLEESNNVDAFWKLLKQTAKKDQFSTHPKDYYEKMLSRFSSNQDDLNGKSRILDFVDSARPNTKSGNFFGDPSINLGQGRELKTKLFLVNYDGKSIGGAIIMLYGDTAYYLHGAMDREYKNLMVPYFMHWEIIRALKAYQLTSLPAIRYYDFWGIDSRKWPGVTRFKLGWGGELKEYPGSFDMPVSRLWYLAYQIARKLPL